jgi:uncharacterized protein YqjF (DUF2071 family)
MLNLSQRLAARKRPQENPILFQNWSDLLFLHWVYDANELQALLPKGLHIDTYKDKAYVGIIPFFMNDIKPAFFGKFLPGMNFYELNVRTYVYNDEGIPGVWFFSLEASSWIATKIGQFFFNLPYHHSSFKVKKSDQKIDYQCNRSTAAFFSYQIGSVQGVAEPGSLEFFLIERYHLFAADNQGKLMQTSVHHEPYQIYDVENVVWNKGPLDWNSLHPLIQEPVHQMASKSVSVEIFPRKVLKISKNREIQT